MLAKSQISNLKSQNLEFQEIKILGTKLDIIELENLLQTIQQAIERRQLCHLVTVNPEIVMLGQKDKTYQNLLNHARIATTDGVGLIWACRFLFHQKIPRITGIDLIWQLAKASQKKHWRFYLLGGENNIAKKAGLELQRNYPKLHLVGAESGGEIDPKKDNLELLSRIKKARPDIILVALGAPRQEQFIAKYQKIINVPVAIGVGGAFDFISGKVRRAPVGVRKLGLEWLWRLILQPWRLKRQLQVVKFVWLVIREKLVQKQTKHH